MVKKFSSFTIKEHVDTVDFMVKKLCSFRYFTGKKTLLKFFLKSCLAENFTLKLLPKQPLKKPSTLKFQI